MRKIFHLKEIKNALIMAVMIATSSILSGCSDKPTSPPPPTIEPSKLFEQERSALEKAKGIEQQLNKSTEQLKQDVEKQSR
ncbi:MAG: hypothetical protein ABL860_07570 [Candidatus Nitrotoga sp.]